MNIQARCFDCGRRFPMSQLQVIKAATHSGRAYACEPCCTAFTKWVRKVNEQTAAGSGSTTEGGDSEG